ncbi:hypothetical protein CgunFtcFv8_011207 [Champsocephalus gunnari]|uniref:Uncharacterized protein n=1 Tax=Champsocephalus gunnari TaxID=52237 RepID=A0AAN8DEE3_CHAGU|nr:hypothetical protein CgunFtcFv8_011207 [Champsocephalus gunnari]
MCLLRCSKTSATRSWTYILRPSRRFLMEGWGQLEPPPAVPPLPPQTRPRLPRPAQPSPKDDGKPSQLSNLEPLPPPVCIHPGQGLLLLSSFDTISFKTGIHCMKQETMNPHPPIHQPQISHPDHPPTFTPLPTTTSSSHGPPYLQLPAVQ